MSVRVEAPPVALSLGDPGATPASRNWDETGVDEALSAFQSSRNGLSETEAARRLASVGPNLLPTQRRRSLLRRLGDQFASVLIYVLLGAAVLTALLGHWLDCGVIVAVLVGNAIVGVAQEGRAERALDAVRNLLAPTAAVERQGKRKTVPASGLVPGDVVFIETGVLIPADLRLIEARALSVDEALLTGESVPSAKSIEAGPPDRHLAERAAMAFAGTTVTAGQGRGLVVATAGRTETGRIGALVAAAQQLETPLIARLAATGRTLTVVILGAAAVTFGVGLLVGTIPVADLFLTVVGLAVAAIPEGLPAIVTIILAVGVRRMTARGALIRRLPAVETLGSVSVICTDKTGTLTRNELVAREVQVAGASYYAHGDGYDPVGSVTDSTGQPIVLSQHPELAWLISAAALCNDSSLRPGADGWAVQGDPIEAALLVLAGRGGLSHAELLAGNRRFDALPFESEHRYMATLHEDRQGQRMIAVKGAPERLLELCAWQQEEFRRAPIDRPEWERRLAGMAERGLRVLAVAAGRAQGARLSRTSVGDDLVFLGLVGFIDPPRTEAVAAIAECRRAGIEVKMVTGDHVATALSVAREIGLDTAGGFLSGKELATLDADAFIRAARSISVFGRVAPEQKLQLVRALQTEGRSVAMTGDGVNDAPALRQADIGVAMGRRGSDAAREAAEMVLVDDNFATIVHAVREGRTVDENLRKTLSFLLPTNAGEALVLIAAVVTGSILPVTALQIIWINFATEVTLGLALAFEPPSADVMVRPPRGRNEAPLLDRRAFLRIGYVAVLMAGSATFLFRQALADGMAIEAARSVAVNAVVATEAACLLVLGTLMRRNSDGKRTTNWLVVLMVTAVSALQLALTQVGPLARAFGMAPLGLREWSWILASGAAVYLLFWAEETIARRMQLRRNRRIDEADAVEVVTKAER